MAKATRTPIVTDRQKLVGVRLSEVELAAIKRRADAVGLRVSQYIRLLALRDAQANPEPQ